MNSVLFKSVLRSLQKRKWYTILSVLGLSVGFSAFIIISLFIKYELSWDRFNENYSNIYRIQTYKVAGDEHIMQSTPAINEFIKGKFSDIEGQALVFSDQLNFLTAQKNKESIEMKGQYADQGFLDMFTYNFIGGSADHALVEPMSIVLSETVARTLFADEDPLGKTVWFEKKHQFKVTGIYEDLPKDAHLHPNFIISINSLEIMWHPRVFEDWNNMAYYNYIQTKPQANIDQLNEQLKELLYDKVLTDKRQLYLKPLSKLYMYSTNDNYMVVIYLLSTFSILVLVLAAINYMNLIIATSTLRAKEIGIKKVIGSNRRQLMGQIFSESLIITIFSFFISILIVELILKGFNQLTDKDISISLLLQDSFYLLIFGILISVSLVSSIYPSWIITSVKSLDLFKQKVSSAAGKKINLKKVLVGFQFAISIGLITVAILLSKQVVYMNSQDLGFNKENLVVAEMDASITTVSIERLKGRLESNPQIHSVSISLGFPMTSSRHVDQLMVNWEGGAREERIEARYFWVNYDFIKTMGMKIVKGRDFSRYFPSDPVENCLINETAARYFGWDDPIGKYIYDKQYKVVGVFKDIHFHDIYNQIKPMVLTVKEDQSTIKNYTYFGFRIAPDAYQESYAIISDIFNEYFPDDPYKISSFDDHFAKDQHFAIFDTIIHVMYFLALVGIILSVLGVVGLVNHALNQRTKEIAIRKVSGCTSWSVFRSLTFEFLIIILIASIAGTIGAKYVFSDFPVNYRMPVHIFDYLIGIILALVITVVSIGYKTLKESRRNPVDALRYE